MKERGYTLQGAREKMRQNREDVVDKVAMIDALTRVRNFLQEMKDQL